MWKKTHFKNYATGTYFSVYLKDNSRSETKSTLYCILMVSLITTHVISYIGREGQIDMLIRLDPLESVVKFAKKIWRRFWTCDVMLQSLFQNSWQSINIDNTFIARKNIGFSQLSYLADFDHYNFTLFP